MKLRGRAEAPNWSRGCTLPSRSCGDTTDSHGPHQRLLERGLATWAPLRLTRNPVVISIHLYVPAVLQKVLRLGT